MWEIVIGVCAGLIIIAVIIFAIVRKKQGKPSCGCDCGSCSGCSKAPKDKSDNN